MMQLKTVIRPAEGQSVWLGGIGVEFKVPGELTGGAFSVVEHHWSRDG
jgi:hypothetical protein